MTPQHIDLEKTITYDMAMNNGRDVCIATLSSKPDITEADVMRDAAQIINEAGLSGSTMKDHMHAARLVGYVKELAHAVSLANALGVRFARTKPRPDGTEGMTASITFPKPATPRISNPKPTTTRRNQQ